MKTWQLFGMCLMAGYGGMLCHFLKYYITGESFFDIKVWFCGHFKTTLLALFATTFAVLIELTLIKLAVPISTESVIGVMVAAGQAGYTSDSLFNRWEGK